MKYYIITSSLNVDNILSSESISPISFYSKRDFGYKNFQKIDELNVVNNIVLFSEIPYFEIRDSERENHPMAIEIDDDVQLKDNIQQTEQSNSVCQIFLYNQSIRLTPWNCRIIFFSQQALVLSKLKCSDSLCNKLSEFYRFELIKPKQLISLHDVLKSSNINESNFNIDLLVAENKINRLKGFLYGYYLGFTKSLSDDVAKLFGIQKKVYNIISSIINNKGESNERFNEELRILENQYNEVDPHKKLLRNLWHDKVLSRFTSLEDKNTFDAILKELYVETEAKLNFCKKNNIVVRKLSLSSINKSFDWSAYQNELSSYTQSIIYEDKSQKTDIALSKDFSVPSDYSTIKLNSNNASIFNEILSTFFFMERVITLEDLRLNRLEIATDFTKGYKAIMEASNKDWNNSPERLFFNSLRQNIANSTPFDIQSAPDILTLSIAAFILKGEDFEALVRYLAENGVSDYKYVISFWGAACGYVDMPKPTLNPIIKQKESFINVYNSVNSLLFKNIIASSFPVVSDEPIISKAEVVQQQVNDEELQSANKYSEILVSVQKKLGKKITEKQLTAIHKALESASTHDNILSCLKKNGIKASTKIYKEFEACLVPFAGKNTVIQMDLYSSSSKQNSAKQTSLSFFTDDNRLNNIKHLISGDKNLKQFKTDLEWFIENHADEYFDSKKRISQKGHYSGKPTDNASILERFDIYLRNKNSNKLKWLSDIYKNIPVESIVEYLKTIYK